MLEGLVAPGPSETMTELPPIPVRHYGSAGRTVVVLHGGPGAPGSAAPLARLLAPHFSVLEPLQRRSGQVALTVSLHVEDLAAIAPQPALLIGWSWGAMLGLSFAARYPDRVSGLVLVGCGTYDEASRTLYQRALERLLGEPGLRELAELRQQLAAEMDPARRDALRGQLGALSMRAQSFEPIAEGAPDGERLAVDDQGNQETWQDVLSLQRQGNEPAAFRAISAPVLMIHGDIDPHHGAATRDVLRAFIPQLEYVELERCGHEPWRERHARDRFRDLVRDFVARS
jgi:pimeloyl-ACP methyl ester carboxylesterase